MPFKVIFLIVLLAYTVLSDIERWGGGFKAEFSVINHGCLRDILMSFQDIDLGACFHNCILYMSCKSVNYNEKERSCNLADDIFDINKADTTTFGWLNYATPPTKISGGWSDWSILTNCKSPCGGIQTTVRSCTNPTPKDGEEKCLLSDGKTKGDNEYISKECNHCEIGEMFIDGKVQPVKEKMICKLSLMPVEYIITFSVKPTDFSTSNSRPNNIFNFFTDSQVFGKGVPGVFFKEKKLKICRRINKEDKCYTSALIPKDQWTKVTIENRRDGNSFIYKILINGTQIERLINNDLTVYKDVLLYASNPFGKVFQGLLRDLKVIFPGFWGEPELLLGKEEKLGKNKKKNFFLKTDFKLKFKIKLISFKGIESKPNIIHLIGKENNQIKVYLQLDGKLKLEINGRQWGSDTHSYSSLEPILLHKWYFIEIVQVEKKCKPGISIYVYFDNVSVLEFDIDNLLPQPQSAVLYYTSKEKEEVSADGYIGDVTNVVEKKN